MISLVTIPCYAAPSNTMSITPAAVDGTTITAADENSRNNEISTKYNAHSHTDISQLANTVNLGDGTAGNKTLQANTADASKPYLRYVDSGNIWVVSYDGVNTSSVLTISGQNISTDVSATGVISGQTLVLSGPNLTIAFAGMTTRGDIETHDGITRVRLPAGPTGYVLTSMGEGNMPEYKPSGGSKDAIVNGFECSLVLADASHDILVSAGTLYHGNSSVTTITGTVIQLDTNSDWLDGSVYSYAGGTGFVYIYVSSAGSIKFDEHAPDYHDTLGNVEGQKLYYYTGGAYYRCIFADRVETGDTLMDFYQFGNRVIWGTSPANIVEGTETSFTDVIVSGYVPTTISHVAILHAHHSANYTFSTRPNGSASATGRLFDGDTNASVVWDQPLDSSGVFEYLVSNGSCTFYASPHGFVMDIR